METNKSAEGAENIGRQVCLFHEPESTCELLLHKLATQPRVSECIRVLPMLCPSCSQKLNELLTTVGVMK